MGFGTMVFRVAGCEVGSVSFGMMVNGVPGCVDGFAKSLRGVGAAVAVVVIPRAGRSVSEGRILLGVVVPLVGHVLNLLGAVGLWGFVEVDLAPSQSQSASGHWSRIIVSSSLASTCFSTWTSSSSSSVMWMTTGSWTALALAGVSWCPGAFGETSWLTFPPTVTESSYLSKRLYRLRRRPGEEAGGSTGSVMMSRGGVECTAGAAGAAGLRSSRLSFNLCDAGSYAGTYCCLVAAVLSFSSSPPLVSILEPGSSFGTLS